MSNKIKLSRLGLEFTEKELAFTVVKDSPSTVDAQPQIAEFYQRALLGQTESNNFKNIPFNKGEKLIPRITTGNVLKAFACSFTDGVTAELSSKSVTVDKMSLMMEICIADLEDTFLVDRMTAGQNNPVNPQEFLTYLWGYLGDQAGEDLEELRWNGDKTNGANAFYKLTDGYITTLDTDKALAGSAIATHITAAGTISDSNVVAELYKAISAIPAKFRKASGRNELKIFVSSDVSLAFQIASSVNTAVGSYNTNTGEMFIGRYQLIEVPTLDPKSMVLVPKEDIIFTYDVLNDESNFIVVDMLKTTAEPKVRFRVNLAVGFKFDELQNVVYYS